MVFFQKYSTRLLQVLCFCMIKAHRINELFNFRKRKFENGAWRRRSLEQSRLRSFGHFVFCLRRQHGGYEYAEWVMPSPYLFDDWLLVLLDGL